MSRRRQDTANVIKEILFILPWWAGLPAAFAAYALFAWVLPSVVGTDTLFGSGMAKAFSVLAFIAAGVVSVCWLSALLMKADRRRLLARQHGLDSIRAMSWKDFERMVGQVFREQGYQVVENGGTRADGGVDLVLKRNGEVTLVQCKHWRTQKVGVEPVRAFFGVVSAANVGYGIFVTTGTFTKPAAAFAKGHVELVSGERLWEMVEELRRRVVTTDRTE